MTHWNWQTKAYWLNDSDRLNLTDQNWKTETEKLIMTDWKSLADTNWLKLNNWYQVGAVDLWSCFLAIWQLYMLELFFQWSVGDMDFKILHAEINEDKQVVTAKADNLPKLVTVIVLHQSSITNTYPILKLKWQDQMSTS